jgi:hypothetical protein
VQSSLRPTATEIPRWRRGPATFLGQQAGGPAAGMSNGAMPGDSTRPGFSASAPGAYGVEITTTREADGAVRRSQSTAPRRARGNLQR